MERVEVGEIEDYGSEQQSLALIFHSLIDRSHEFAEVKPCRNADQPGTDIPLSSLDPCLAVMWVRRCYQDHHSPVLVGEEFRRSSGSSNCLMIFLERGKIMIPA